jgi:hypothetical protein
MAPYKAYGPPRPSRFLSPDDDSIRFECVVEPPASNDEISEHWHIDEVPTEVRELWLTCSSAILFKDIDYGQWGLRILSPSGAAADTADSFKWRKVDLKEGDIVVGKFIGDQERVLFTTNNAGDKQIMIMLEIDERKDFPIVANSLAEFLTLYWEHHGDKYWE